jgi:hypothetical protein
MSETEKKAALVLELRDRERVANEQAKAFDDQVESYGSETMRATCRNQAERHRAKAEAYRIAVEVAETVL